MPRVDPVQSNFTSGEISPEVFGNFQLERYKQALKTCENFTTKKTGGVSRRGGTKFIKEVKDSADQTILQPFNYKDEYQYMLEFGDLYIRVYRNQAYVCEVVTTYDEADVADLRFTQDEERLYIVHPNYPPAILTRTSHTDWSLDDMEFDVGSKLTAICWSDELGLFVAITNVTTGNYVKVSKDGIYWETFDGVDGYAWNDVCWGAGAGVFVAIAPASAGPTGGVMTSPDGKTWTLRTAAEANSYLRVAWSESLTLFAAISSDGTNQVMTSPDGITWTARSAASSETWTCICWDETNEQFYAMASTAGTYDGMYSANGTAWTGVVVAGLNWRDICWSPDLELYAAISYDSPASALRTSPDGTTWTARTVADNETIWNRIRWCSELGLFVCVGYANTIDLIIQTSPDGITWTAQDCPKNRTWDGLAYSSLLQKVIAVSYDSDAPVDNMMYSLDGETWVKQFSTGISNRDWQTDNYPSICWFYEQRFFMAATPNQPNKIYGSRSTQYNVFDVGTGLDNEAIIVTLKEATKLLWATTSNAILLGAKNGVFRLSSTSNNEALTPTNIRPLRLNKYGAAFVNPVDVDGKTVYLQKDSRKMRSMDYELLSDKFKSIDLLVLHQHLTKGGISKLIYVDEPDSLIFGIRTDGELMGLLYDTEYKIVGGFRYVLSGTDALVKSIAVSENPTTNEDEIWVIIERTINSSTVQYVEILTQGLASDEDWEDAEFMDSFVSKSGSQFTTFDGLDHLEGETVQVFADGLQKNDQTVSSGQITIPAADYAIAGLQYNSILETLPLEGGNPIGSAMGKIKRISKLVLRLYRSYKFYLGDLLGNTSEYITPSSSDYTGDTNELDFYGTHETGGQIKITVSAPYAFNLLSIMYKERPGE